MSSLLQPANASQGKTPSICIFPFAIRPPHTSSVSYRWPTISVTHHLPGASESRNAASGICASSCSSRFIVVRSEKTISSGRRFFRSTAESSFLSGDCPSRCPPCVLQFAKTGLVSFFLKKGFVFPAFPPFSILPGWAACPKKGCPVKMDLQQLFEYGNLLFQI